MSTLTAYGARAGILVPALCVAIAGCGTDTPTSDRDNPLPVLTSLTPELVVVGQASADVNLEGSGFVNGSQARLDGADRVTTYVGPQELTMSLTSTDLGQGGTYDVAVVNGPPGGGTSGVLTLTVGYPAPELASLAPELAEAGSDAITLTVTGSGFVSGASVVRWGNIGLTTTYVDASTLSAEVPANLLANAGFVNVTVANPAPGGGASAPVQFAVGHPLPVLASASPTTITGGRDTRLSVVGEKFVSSTLLVWNGDEYVAQVVSGSVLYADLPASAFVSSGPATIAVRTPPPGGGTSSPIDVVVVDPPPVVSGFTPASVQAGSPAFTLRVHGANFSAASEVRWNGAPKTTTFVDASTLDVDVTAGDVSTAGSGMLSVHEPDGAVSHVVGFPIVPASPAVTASVSVQLGSADLVADPSGDIVYAAVPASSSSYANEVVALDPLTGDILWSTLAGSDPRRVVVSDDGAYLYVAVGGASSVIRIDVANRAKDLDIPLPSGQRAEDILVLPGSPTSIVVSLRNTCCSPRHEGVVVFDGDIQRPLATQGHTGSNRIEPSSNPERIYGYNNETTEFGFRRILVRSDGLIQDGVFGGVVTGFGNDIVYDGGLIFTARGRVVDPEAPVVLGTIAGTGAVRPDVANGRVHFLDGGVLTAYHLSTFTSFGSVGVPEANGLTVLVRFGPDGMAFGGGDTIVFVRSDLVGS